MKIQDFKFIFILTFLILFGIWFFCSFFAIPFEDGTNKSFIPKYCFQIAKLIMFTLDYWFRFLNMLFAFIFALLTSTIIISVIIYLIISLKEILKLVKLKLF